MLRQVLELDRRLPAWLRPTFRGAVCPLGLGVGAAGKLFVAILVGTLVLMVGVGPGVRLFLGLLGVAMAAGAVGGTIRGAFRPLDGWGRPGAWARWFLAIAGAIAAAVVLTPRGPFQLGEPTFHFLAMSLAAVAAGGLLLLDDRRPGRPTRRRFTWLQNRERLWAAADRARARRQRGPGGISGGSAPRNSP